MKKTLPDKAFSVTQPPIYVVLVPYKEKKMAIVNVSSKRPHIISIALLKAHLLSDIGVGVNTHGIRGLKLKEGKRNKHSQFMNDREVQVENLV